MSQIPERFVPSLEAIFFFNIHLKLLIKRFRSRKSFVFPYITRIIFVCSPLSNAGKYANKTFILYRINLTLNVTCGGVWSCLYISITITIAFTILRLFLICLFYKKLIFGESFACSRKLILKKKCIYRFDANLTPFFKGALYKIIMVRVFQMGFFILLPHTENTYTYTFIHTYIH